MKNIILLSLVIFSSLFTACNKDDNVTPLACQDVEYGSAFNIEALNKYCFPDDISLTILALKNEFCPCDVVCVWEGEMVIDMQWILASEDTTIFSFHQGGTIVNDSIPAMLSIRTDVEDIIFESECDDGNPSPEILSTTITVTK